MAGVQGYMPPSLPNGGRLTTTDAYQNALEDQGKDYSYLMGAYKNLYGQQTPTAQIGYNPINYQESGDVASSLKNLSDLSQTGGYSAGDIANIRARGVSPIRSIYSSAQQGLQRQRALQGGYSPNFAAVSAKMARDQSQQIADQVTNVNAQLAQNIASNKLAAATPYASAAGAEANRAQGASEFNANNQLDTAKTNASIKDQNTQRPLDILKSATGLYGTGPAATQVLGSQVLGANAQNNSNLNDQYSRQNSYIQNYNSTIPRFM